MANIEKEVKVKLITHWENYDKVQEAQSLFARLKFRNVAIFSENLVPLKKKKYYDKHISLSFFILDIYNYYTYYLNFMKIY